MNQYLIYVSRHGERPMPSWQSNLYNRGIVVMTLRTLAEGIHAARAYHAMLLMMEIDDMAECVRELQAAREAAATPLPPVIGVMAARPGGEELAALAEAGLADLIAADDPVDFIIWRLDMLCRLRELARFEQSRMDVAELAKKTRVILHDLSQPLSAVQGRLQLLAVKCPASDPNYQVYQDLVRMAFDVTHQLMEVQQLHRQFS